MLMEELYMNELISVVIPENKMVTYAERFIHSIIGLTCNNS